MADSLDLLWNFGTLTLNANVATTPSAGTSEAWTVVATSAIPSIPSGMQIRMTVGPSSDLTAEVVGVTAVNDGTHIQVTRGLEGTIKTHSSGDALSATITAGWLNQVGHLNPMTAHATTTGAVTRTFGAAWDVGFQDIITGNTTYTFSAAGTVSGFICRMELRIDNSAGHTVTFPAVGGAVDYSNGTAPTVGTGVYYFTLLTMDGGTLIVMGLAIPAAA